MKSLAKVIQANIHTKDKTSICFLGYIMLFTMKSLLENNESEDYSNNLYKYLERPLTHTKDKNAFVLKDKVIKNSFKLNDIDSVLNLVETFLESYKSDYFKNKLGEDFYDRVNSNWQDLGLKEIRIEANKNKAGLNKVIEAFDKVDNFNIEKLIDLFEELNVSDKYFNDFFTPNDITKLISKMVSKDVQIEKNTINIYDPSCGIGRLLYHSFIELKEKYPNKTINIFGIDLCNRFVVFTESIFNLINVNHTFIERGNTLTDNFNFPQMDICLSNPPYDKKNIELEFVEHIENLGCNSYMVLPNSFSFHKKAETLRMSLMNKNLLKSIIQLPSNMFKNTSIPTQIVVLNNDPLKELEKFAIKNKGMFRRIDPNKDIKLQIEEFENELKKDSEIEEYRNINLLEMKENIKSLITELYLSVAS